MCLKASGIAVLGLAAVLLSAAPLCAQSREDWRATEKQSGSATSLESSYAGVVPGAGNNLPQVAALKDKPGIWVTWPGFIMAEDGSSRLFLQTTVKVEYELTGKKNRYVLKLKNAKIFLNNNRNPLVTSHFNTPLDRAHLKRRRKGAELALEMRIEHEPTIRQQTDGDGYHYLFIEFPPGDYPVKGSDSGARPSFSGYGTRKEPTAKAPPAKEE